MLNPTEREIYHAHNHVKMPTVACILTLINMIIFQHFSFYEQLKFHAQLSIKKRFVTSGPGKRNLFTYYSLSGCLGIDIGRLLRIGLKAFCSLVYSL